MFIKNQKVDIRGNKIVALQGKSTPGIYKIFTVEPNKTYYINLIGFKKQHPKQFLLLWITDVNNKFSKMISIKGEKYFKYHHTHIESNKIKIGILFKYQVATHFFILDNITLSNDEPNINDLELPLIQFNKPSSTTSTTSTTNNPNKISVVIPCLYLHLIYIKDLLNNYTNIQTITVNEIVLVIADANKLEDQQLLEDIMNIDYPYELKIIKINGKSLAGNSRYIGISNASNDIIIFQDADDIPHKQRTEIIYYYFKKYLNVVHICHKWCKKEDEFNKLNETGFKISKIKYSISNYNIFLNKKFRKLEHIANGNIAIRKKIYTNIDWHRKQLRRQDIATNIDILKKYNGLSLFIKEKIYLYRHDNSTYDYVQKNYNQ